MPESSPTLVLGTSLRGDDRAAVETGTTVARALAADLHLVHAFHLPLWLGDTSPLPPEGTAPILRKQRRLTETRLAEQAAGLSVNPGRLVDIHLEAGPPHRILDRVARRLEADLILVGAADAEGGRRHLLGSTAERLLARATRPVMVLRPGLVLPPRRVLIPVDLSPLSADAFRAGLALLEALAARGSWPEARVLFVLDPRSEQLLDQFTAPQVQRFAHSELDRFVHAHAGELGARVDPRVARGRPREAIVAEADRFAPDLVITGTHGRSGFDRLVLGSVAVHTARQVRTTLLVVPPEAALRAALSAEAAERSEAPEPVLTG